MTHRTALTASITLGVAALLLSGCSDDSDDGQVQIETSAETETDADLGSGDAEDAQDSGDSDPEGEGLVHDSSVVLAGTTYEYTILCTRGGDVVDLAMTGTSDVGPFTAAFGAGNPVDSIELLVDGAAWRTDSNGDYGELQSLDVDVDGGSASGMAVFETEAGDTADGSFDLVCAGP